MPRRLWLFLVTMILIVAFIGSVQFFEPSAQPSYNSHNGDTKKKTANDTPFCRFWNWSTRDPVAFYTSVLAVFTGCLVVISAVQIRFLIRADENARKSADALPALERAYLFVGIDFFPTLNMFDQSMIHILRHIKRDAALSKHRPIINANAKLIITNYGKTPGIITYASFGFSMIGDENDIPDHPDSFIDFEVPPLAADQSYPDTPDYSELIKQGYKIEPGYKPWDITLDVSPEQSAVIREGEAFIVALARIKYRDIFGQKHESAICRLYNGKEDSFSYHGGQEYNYRT
jgi:hypothetical protein